MEEASFVERLAAVEWEVAA